MDDKGSEHDVAQAVWAMAAKLCPDRLRATVALVSAAVVLSLDAAWAQVSVLAAGALFGFTFLQGNQAVINPHDEPLHVVGWGWCAGLVSLALFLALLFGLPAWRTQSGNAAVAVVDSFFRTGSLVFGGGHIILPLLQAETVTPGWVSNDRFLAGYGLAQALPGPLSTFAAYLRAVFGPPRPGGWAGALLCLVAIFLPSGLLVLGILPFWENLRRWPAAQAALRGTNAAVVGLLLVALYQPVWTSAVHTAPDFVLSLVVFGLLVFWKWPPWLTVALAAVAGACFLTG